MAISCAHCGGAHERPEEVRRCWNDGGRVEPVSDHAGPADPGGPPDLAADLGPARSTSGSRVPVRRGAATAGAGPSALARNLVVGPGAPVPPEWAECDRIEVGRAELDRPDAVIARLQAARIARRRVVVDLHAEFDRAPMLMTEAEPHRLGPRFGFDLEQLHHLVWSNGVDARDPAASTWAALDLAVAHGWTPAPPDGAGDVVDGAGRPVWIDGGPLSCLAPIDGVPVIHVVAVEHGGVDVPATNESTAALAPDQLAAVTHAGGAARIVAPAGSGKTRVLTERARHLVERWRLPVEAVMLVAFNKRAQEEMRDRLADIRGLQVRTLNSLALAIVNGSAPFERRSRTWTTIDEPDVRRILGELVSFPRRRNSDPVAPWIEALGLVRLGLLEPAEVEARYDGEVEGFAAVWPAYRARLERLGAVDFDDQVHRALLVLLTDPVARRTAQRACRVMLVDEFQDLTPAHVLLIRLLAAPGGEVFGVGDDDQTIYGYNGADPSWLIDFAELFPGAGDHPLEVNYRCPAGIVDAVDRLLRHNSRRVAKTIRASSDDSGGWSVDESADPVAATTRAVEGALAAGAAPADIAVLTRVNALSAPPQVALTAAGVPIAGGVGLDFLDRTSVRAALSWLRLALAVPGARRRFDPDDVREALRRPSRSFHPRIVDWIAEQASVVDLFKLAERLNRERDAERLAEFAGDVQTLQRLVERGATTSDLLLALVDEVGLAGSVATLDATRRGMNRGAQGDDLTAVTHLAALHDDPATFEHWLRTQLTVRRDPQGVVLATVHRVKGQEWPHVVVHLADTDQYPHRLADDVEEERRLFHVALTRASATATIVTGPRPSPFVEELTCEPDPQRVVAAHAPSPTRTPPSAARPDPVDELDADARVRFDALRTLRNELRDDKPAYVVFDNKTLAAIARAAPTSKAELARISGVGPAKLERYGEAVTALMAELLA